ncbi:MAG: uroporphyrinogen decarboxylase family protein [Planctomycetota bacterium]
MTDRQWNDLLRILAGEEFDALPVGFLVDGPWMAAQCGASLMDYFTDNGVWLEANRHACECYPEVLWLPGFWAEFGMISNPPAFGTRCIWPEDGFPSCEPVLQNYADIACLKPPNVRTDGLLPLMIQRLKRCLPEIEQSGHRIRFATAHGPLTIGAYLLGHTQFFLGMREAPEAIERLLGVVTEFVVRWLSYQKECFPSIEGILVLEDLMGFVGEVDFRRFALPYMTQIFQAIDVPVRFLHNDAAGLITAKHLSQLRVNLFNFSFEHDFCEIRRLAGDEVTLLGNIPPRDVLALGTVDDVRQSVTTLLERVPDRRRMIVSAGGFTPGQFTPEKIRAFCAAARAAA